MKHDDDFIAQLEDYLVEFDGVTPLPDRVRDAIHVELPRTRQAQARPGLMRMQPMLSTISSRAPLGVAAAAVVVAVVLGATFVNRSSDQTGVGVPRLASPSLDRAPLVRDTNPNPHEPGECAAGVVPRHQATPNASSRVHTQLGSTTLWPAVVSLEVPGSWWYYEEGTGYAGVLVDRHPDVPNGSGWGVMFNTIGSVSVDPCDEAAGMHDENVGTPGAVGRR